MLTYCWCIYMSNYLLQMEVTVSVKCTDQEIRVSIGALLKNEYFTKQLSNFDTKMTLDTKIITTVSGKNQQIDCWNIPQLTVDCTSTTLLKLLFPKYNNWDQVVWDSSMITNDNDNDNFIEYLIYNDMYCFNHVVKFEDYRDVGYVEKHFDILLFIKRKLPTVNVYTVTKCIWNWDDFLCYSFKTCSIGKLDEILIIDLLDYIDYGLTHQLNKLMINVLRCIVYLNDSRFNDIIFKKINTDKIGQIINKFVRENADDYDHLHTYYDDGEFANDFYKRLSKLYDVLTRLNEMKIIDLKLLRSFSECKQDYMDMVEYKGNL